MRGSGAGVASFRQAQRRHKFAAGAEAAANPFALQFARLFTPRRLVPVLVPRTPLRLSLSLILAVLGGCALSPPTAGSAAPGPAAKDDASTVIENKPAAGLDSLDAQVQYHVLAGELAAGRQQPKVAAEEFLQVLDRVPDAALAARTTGLALAANDAPLALKASRRWLAIEPTSLEAREVITRLALRQGNADEAYEQSAAIVRDHPGGKEDGFRHVALLLSQDGGDGAGALALMAKLLAQYPKLAGAWSAQSLLALRFNEFDLAEKSAREALRLQPASKEAPLLLAGALVHKGDLVGADQIMEAQFKNNATTNDLRLGYVRLLIEANQRARAREQLQKILKLDANDADAQFTLGLLALDDRRVDEAEPYFLALAKGGERAVDAQYYLGRIAEFRNQPAQALARYEKVTSGNQALDAAVRRANMLARLGHLTDARTTLQQLRQQFPPLSTRFYLAEGQLLLEANAYDDALILYADALKEHEGDADLLYARSLVYERADHIDLAEADLRAVLAQNAKDGRALNALGYMLVVHTKRYAEAEKLIGQALALTPEEPAVIDSMGWLRYRQGRNNEALTLLTRAYERFPDPEVGAHFGELLWVTGDHERAQAVWARAKAEAPDNAVLRETLKRLMP